MNSKTNIAENRIFVSRKTEIKDRITSLILHQRKKNMTKSFFAFLLILKISLSLQSNEDWSFEEDSKGGWSTEVSNEAEMLFNGRIYGGREAVPSKIVIDDDLPKIIDFDLQILGHSLCPCNSSTLLESKYS